MAEENLKSKKSHWSFKPVVILAVAAILISRSQRVSSEGDVPAVLTTTEISTTDHAVCPDYCNLMPEPTKGKAPFKMWYYDASEGGCRRFKWSGRGGNKNRFYKNADCEETCSKCTLHEFQQVQRTDIKSCSPPLDEGRCDQGKGGKQSSSQQPQLVWYFDNEKAKCSPFIFHGCGGNSNRYASKSECEDVCQ